MSSPASSSTQKIHILLVHQAFVALDEPGGTRHFEMAQSFASKGHRVTVITSPISYLTGKSGSTKIRWKTREEIGPGITVIRAYAYPALHRSFFHRLLNFFSFMLSSFIIGVGVKNVDVVWGTSPPIFQAWTAWLLARLKGVKFLLEIRDLWPAFAVAMNVLKNPLLIRLSNWLERFLYRHADQLVVNSPGFIDHITKRGGRNIELIANGVDPDMFTPGGNGVDFRLAHGFADKYVIMYAGAHGISNDLEVMLSAARLTSTTEKLVYVLVGDGKEKGNLMRLAQEWNLTNVFFFPPFPKTEMPRVLAAADACLAILKPVEMYKTTYPNKVFDYMAAGKPVLCAIDGVIREVVESAQAGVFVPPGDPNALADAAEIFASAPTMHAQMGTNGRKYVEIHFNRLILAEKMENLLVNLIIRST